MGWLRRYIASDDPFVAAANFVAVVLGWNQPFYPLYLWVILGEAAWGAAVVALSAIPFLAIPAITRRWSLAGRLLLPMVGMANTVACTILLGERSAVGLFLLPCAMLAAILFPWRERFAMVGVTALPLGVWLVIRGRWNEGIVAATDAQFAALFTMNAVSVGCLMVFLGWILAGINAATMPRPRLS
jgi:hypothetical protein